MRCDGENGERAFSSSGFPRPEGLARENNLRALVKEVSVQLLKPQQFSRIQFSSLQTRENGKPGVYCHE